MARLIAFLRPTFVQKLRPHVTSSPVSRTRSHSPVRFLSLWLLAFLLADLNPARAQITLFGGNPQHTAQYAIPAQHLNQVRWSTPVDLLSSGGGAHYGAPLVTPANTVLVSVRTSSGFKINAFQGTTGTLKYTLSTDYVPPNSNWLPTYNPAIAPGPSAPRLYYAGAGGTIYYVDNPDSDTPGAPVHQCFYASLPVYNTNASGSNGFNNTVFVNTPITAGPTGTVYFGFRVQQTAPPPLNTTNGGFVRLDPAGNATYVFAPNAAGDPLISRVSHNCAPALSNDGSTLYVAVKWTNDAFYAYLLGLDSATLATKYKVLLRDPRNGEYAGVLDDATASPMVAPDGDVFFGVFSNPNNGSRGFMLHFSSDLTTQKTPSGFGWDYTPAIVPTNMVPGYTGTSPYLLFSKYNNYAATGDGDGVNKIALLDPFATQIDPHPTANRLVEMREILTMTGPTPDTEYFGSVYPHAVREWCINSAAVNPATATVFAPSEDGRLYRWNLQSNSLTETITLGSGFGEPYVPTSIGPDGTIYTLNAATLFAIGHDTNAVVGIYSSAPDSRSVVAGQPLSFTAVVTNSGGPAPTGTITFQDQGYDGLTTFTNVLAADVPLTSGVAQVTNVLLTAGGTNLGNHFITAFYSGHGNSPAGTATLVQKIHALPSALILSSSLVSGSSNRVTLNATVTSAPPGSGQPSGMVSFWDGPRLLGQVPLATNGTTALTITNFSGSQQGLTAAYASDTVFASSSNNVAATSPLQIGSVTLLPNGSFQLAFTNAPGGLFSILGTTDLSVPLTNWIALGRALEVAPGTFQFTDSPPPDQAESFYRLRSP